MATDTKDTDFSAGDGHGYLLDRSYLAACRLNLQHYLWRDALGFGIHPSIKIDSTATIADVGAGSGMWLIEVARDMPQAQLMGLDKDLTQAPHPKWLPTNIQMRPWNIFEDLPTDLIARFDLVHVRLLVLAMGKDDAPSIMSRIAQMLKPGGFVQWDDLNCRDMHVKRVAVDVEAPALDKLRAMSWANGRHDWLLDLHELMEGAGLAFPQLQHYGDKTDMIRAFNEQHLLTMDEFAVTLTRLGKKDEAEVFRNIIQASYQESLKGAALCIPRVVCVARRPS